MRLFPLIVLMLTTLCFGQDRIEVLYAAGDFVGAQVSLQKLLAQASNETEEGRLYYKLGNCAFRSGNLPEAIRCYRSCLRRIPHHQPAMSNLTLAKSRLSVTDRSGQENSGIGALYRIVSSYLSFPLTILLQTLWGIFLVVFRRRRLLFVISLLALLLTIWASVECWQRERSTLPKEAIILSHGAELRQEPHPSAYLVKKIGPGTCVEILCQSEEWAKVKWKGRFGWIPSRMYGEID